MFYVEYIIFWTSSRSCSALYCSNFCHGPPSWDYFYRRLTQHLQVFPSSRSSHSIGPGIEVREDPLERRRREQDLNDMTSLE